MSEDEILPSDEDERVEEEEYYKCHLPLKKEKQSSEIFAVEVNHFEVFNVFLCEYVVNFSYG